MKPYDYAHREGVEVINWDRFSTLSQAIVEHLAKEKIDIIIGIARAGLFPATAVSCMLRRELYPVRITRRVNDEVVFEKPIWRVDLPEAVSGKRVAIVDEIADSGETLVLVKSRARELGAGHIITACLVAHTWAKPRPDIAGLVSDGFIIFPWDERVFINGKWSLHPEIATGLKLQKNKIQHKSPGTKSVNES